MARIFATASGQIALFGNGARATIKGGTGDVNSRFIVNVEQGLKEAGFEVTTDNWLDRFDSMNIFVQIFHLHESVIFFLNQCFVMYADCIQEGINIGRNP